VKSSFIATTVDRALRWARANSLWFVSTGGGCCADEVMSAVGCRYDLERFGCLEQSDPGHADLLIVSGAVSYKSAPVLQDLYEKMMAPKYVIAIGACASGGGPFGPEYSYSTMPGLDRIIPVDVYVPGCPPRPEAVMNALITLQEKVVGNERAHSKT